MSPARPWIRKQMRTIKAVFVINGAIESPHPLTDITQGEKKFLWPLNEMVVLRIVMPCCRLCWEGSRRPKRLPTPNVVVHPFDLSVVDTGRLAMALVEAATMVLATPTVLMGPHPLVVYAAFLANTLKPKTRLISLISSFGWGGKVTEQVANLLGQLQAEMLPPVMVKGAPKTQDLQAIECLAQAVQEKHQALGLVSCNINYFAY